MNTSASRSASTRWRQLLPAALIAATALGTITHPAIAKAEWDIGLYDRCMKHNDAFTCCYLSDGKWDQQHNKCVAPALKESVGPKPSKPARPVPVGPRRPSPTPRRSRRTTTRGRNYSACLTGGR
jgi:hypothetical protein